MGGGKGIMNKNFTKRKRLKSIIEPKLSTPKQKLDKWKQKIQELESYGLPIHPVTRLIYWGKNR